ncbi:SDR family NAD(P)-dependent oxidoreductase, partial [Mycobacterium sp. E3339]|uniref:SDR family NAD(P)-dependent oxidoreductase n=1 Tax=Mycobacterium sp. E3339 TaxID=1834146 RepID=UPI000A79C925
MDRVSVITGGAGGMGLATAKLVAHDHAVVLCDVRQDRLEAAAATLGELGANATAVWMTEASLPRPFAVSSRPVTAPRS